MKTPRFLIGATLLFWGQQTGLFAFAALAALFLEGSRLVTTRLQLGTRDFHRVWNLCAIIFLGAIVFVYASNRGSGALLIIGQWLPMMFLPMIAAQLYSASGRVKVSAFSMFYRQWENSDARIPSVNLEYPFVALCALSASAANTRSPLFFAGIILLAAGALWPVRSRRYSPAVWAATLALAAGLGYTGSVGLTVAQKAVERRITEWFSQLLQGDFNPLKTHTAIGEIGSLKLSGRILFRVAREDNKAAPVFLPRSSYNMYRLATWYAANAPFSPVTPEPDGLSWRLTGKASRGGEGVIVSSTFSNGRAVLTAPNDTARIERLPVTKMTRNRMGAVVVEGWPGLASYRLIPGDGSLNGPTDVGDLHIQKRERPYFARLADELGLYQMEPKEIVRTVERFFAENFTYSLDLDSGRFSTPLEDFLFRTRSGHCEYFATATVLLLRTAGVPARYVLGYVANEYSPLEGRFIVRERDAHTWTLARVSEKWITVDTTPAAWLQDDKQYASVFEPFYDLWAYAALLFNQWRWSEGGGYQRYLLFALIPLSLFLVWRIVTRPKVTLEKEAAKTPAGGIDYPGHDSGMYEIERRLGERGLTRYRWETISAWINRLQAERNGGLRFDSLRPIARLHYRHRFDPAGLTEREQEKLASAVTAWLDRFDAIEKEIAAARTAK